MKKRHILSSISFRLLVFNVLIVFFPIASFLFLSTYEQQLLQSLEHAMVQQGRVMAAALGGTDTLTQEQSEGLLVRLQKEHDARFRILDMEGRVLADSSLLPIQRRVESDITIDGAPGKIYRSSAQSWDDYDVYDEEQTEEPEGRKNASENILYRIASFPVRLLRNYLLPPAVPIESGDFYQGVEQLLGREVKTALEGKYGAATRISTGGQISVTLYSALPVFKGSGNPGPEEVTGVVLVSQSSYRILQDLYRLRLDIFKIFLISLLAAVIISIFLSITISRPIKKLNLRAQRMFTPGGKLQGTFSTRNRKDEIGKLAAALDRLTEQLREHIAFIESFAADVSHELKNPIASIRSSAEIAAESIQSSPVIEKEAGRFLSIIQSEAARMESLISSIRDISTIDTRLQEEDSEAVDIGKLSAQIVEGYKLRSGCKEYAFRLQAPDYPIRVLAAPERIIQVLANIIDNSISFSPPAGVIGITISESDESVLISVCDEGPGIPQEIADSIFSRFFTYREGKDTGKRDQGPKIDSSPCSGAHTGLGLAIVKAIVEGYDGSVQAENRPGGGACFTVILPLY